MAFDFDAEVKKFYNATVTTMLLKDAYGGKSQTANTGSGIYALYCDGELKKIGKSVYGKGIFNRMSQYYQMTKAGAKQITNENRDKIKVKFFFLSSDECWIAERRLQVAAWDAGEQMPWEAKNRS